jgi:glyoxylase-like metal-dependent hydrolase (beta-lactamase superfamily II)
MVEQILQQVSEHIWWMPPSKPDRPSLCAVVGERSTLMLDAGASDAHTRLFLDQLAAKGLPAPRFVALTHWHWDHTFGAAEIGVPIIAHPLTAHKMEEMAGYEWDDEAMEARVAAHLGIPTERGMKDIQEEVPSPRRIRFAQPDILVKDSITFDLGGITCQVHYVGGDHAADSCVMFIPEDSLLFLGDCLYHAIFPKQYYTVEKMHPLIDSILAHEAEHYIEGHADTVMSRAEFMVIIDKMRRAGELVQELANEDVIAVLDAATERGIDAADEDFSFFVKTLVTGRNF